MGKPCSSPITREFLYQAYCVEKLTVVTIARTIGCRTTAITNALKEHGFFQRGIEKDWLIEHYVLLQESIDDIVAMLEKDEATVRHYLRLYDIPIRYKSRGSIRVPLLNDHAWLHDQYVVQQHSVCWIADTFNVTESSLMRALIRAGIMRRNPEFYAKRRRGQRSINYRRQFSRRKRRLIFQRDDYHCQMPGCEATTKLETHHILPRHKGGSNALDNGITLCATCHATTYTREEEFAPLFLSIIAGNREPLA